MSQFIINVLTFPYSLVITYLTITVIAAAIGYVAYKKCTADNQMRALTRLMIIATLTIAICFCYHFGALTAADKYNDTQVENANVYVDTVGHIISTPSSTNYHTTNLDVITVHNRDRLPMHDTIEPGTTISYKLYSGLTKNTFSYDIEDRAEILSTKIVETHYLSEQK